LVTIRFVDSSLDSLDLKTLFMGEQFNVSHLRQLQLVSLEEQAGIRKVDLAQWRRLLALNPACKFVVSKDSMQKCVAAELERLGVKGFTIVKNSNAL